MNSLYFPLSHHIYIYTRRFGISVYGLWKDIRKEWLTFSQNSVSSLGNGRRLGFWKDPWCNETVLCNAFPTLFNLSAHKDARVADVWDSLREEGG